VRCCAGNSIQAKTSALASSIRAASLETRGLAPSATCRHCLRAASASSWAKAVPIGVGQGIAQELYPAALPRRAQDLGDGGLQPLLCVRDRQLGVAQAAAGARVIISSRSAPRRVTRLGRR
jgi:hypothetical protein